MKRQLLTGLILLLPIAVTLAILAFIIDFLTKPFMGIVSHFLAKSAFATKGILFLSPDQTLRYASQLIILICLITVIWVLGAIARHFIVNALIQFGDNILHRLPLINKIYKTVKEIINTLFGQGKNSFQQVVMVPFPENGIYCLGFLSEIAPTNCSNKTQTQLHSVFIPTAPNPATGFIVMYNASDIIFLDMKVEEALKYIVSCGMVATQEEPTGGRA